MQFVDVKGGKIATEQFGSRQDPALILIMGATASMLGWPDALCTALARKGLFVIRFDHRDTGMSTAAPPGQPDYAVEDMADDVVAIMDAYRLTEASLMGMSLGGYIAQMLALRCPDRVKALVLMSAEPLGWDGPALPHIAESFLAHFGKLSALDWTDEEAVAEFLMGIERLSAGGGQQFDEEEKRARIGLILRRASSPASMFNHASLSVRDDWSGRFRDIACPVLVIHGTDDPVLPVENGRAISVGIAGSSFLPLEGVGHEIPEFSVPIITESVAAHILTA